MTTPNINITAKNVQGRCDLKCAYNFTYDETNLRATNEGIMISLTPDNSKTSPVTYNTQKYNVNKISIVAPSIHTFNGETTNAEIIIEHSPVKSGNLLSVAIPIISSSEISSASNFINDIIKGVATNAPAKSETTTLNIDGFSLQHIVPKKPFYSYTNKTTDWIVFDKSYAIPLSSSILTTLGQIIKPFPLPTPGEELFINKTGPNVINKNDDLYISCNPTDSSEEEIPVEYEKNTPSYDLNNMLSSPLLKTILQGIIGFIIFIVIFLIFNYLYTYITTGSIQLSTIQGNNNANI